MCVFVFSCIHFIILSIVWIKIVKSTSGLNSPHIYLVGHLSSIGPSVNTCQTFQSGK